LEQQILVLGTGGTIAGRAKAASDHVNYRAGDVPVEDLLDGMRWPAGGWRCEQLAQMDSKDMDHATWRQLAQRVEALMADATVAGVVITHGTDTVEETAFFLSCVLSPSKPVVLTCAMRPVTALSPDGPQNLQDAIDVASSGVGAVMVVAAGTIHCARRVSKVHPYRTDAFASVDGGPLGVVEQGKVRWWQKPPLANLVLPAVQLPPANEWPHVSIWLSHAGADGEALLAWLAHARPHGAAAFGMVAVGTGNATLHARLEPALLEAERRGWRVWRTSRCAEGRSVPGADDAETRALPVVGLLAVKARIALMLSLMPGSDQVSW
jgi:L-asparaginase